MRHGARTQSFNRPFNQRKWLMRNLAISLVEHERITTTLQKAKELRRVVEKAVTLGKKGSLADRRLLMSRIPNTSMVQKVFAVLAPRFGTRSGGYTRIMKLTRRPGDNAEMAIIEFIDYQIKQVNPEATKKAQKAKLKADKKIVVGGGSGKATAKKEAKAVKRQEGKAALKAEGKPKAKAKPKA